MSQCEIIFIHVVRSRYLPCGCNAPLLCYLPGNGALLAAVSMLVNFGVFPDSWGVVAEGFPPTV